MTSVGKAPVCESKAGLSGQKEPANDVSSVPDASEGPPKGDQKKVKKRVARRPKSLPPTPRRAPPDTGDVGTLGPRIKSSASLQTPIAHHFLSKPATAARKPLEEKVNNQQPVEPKKTPAPSKDKENGKAVEKKSPARHIAKEEEPTKTSEPAKTQKKQPFRQVHEKQSKLTEFFVARRSERKPKQESEALLKKRIEERLRLDNDDDLGLEIREVPDKGRGVFTTQHFLRGDFVVEYSGDLIDVKNANKREGEYAMDLTKGCYMYYFKANGKDYCIDATKESGRLGRLINHSKLKPNLRTKVVQVDKTPRLILSAARDIARGEELLYDYGDRSKPSLEAHPWLAF